MRTLPDRPIINEMMRGFIPLEKHFAEHPLAPKERLRLATMVNVLQLVKCGYKPLALLRGKKLDIPREIAGNRGFEINIRGDKTREKDGEHYLSEAELAEFKQTGVLGPYRAISTEEAASLREYANHVHARDYDGTMIFGNEKIREVLKRNNLWNLNYGGMYQALRYPKFWDLLCRDEITQRVASLLGNDLLCWRSQFFEKQPGSDGTFWHQTGTFREGSERPKLIPTREINDSMVQLTVWTALSDTTIRNGCMRLMPGSFTDARFESFTWALLDKSFPYLMTLDRASIQKALHALKFSTGNFVKAQLVYEFAVTEIPDLFDGFATHDLEMKAGECVIFTSLNTHGSYPNLSDDDTRLAIAGRYTTNDVQVLKGFTTEQFPTPQGPMEFELSRVGCMQAHGTDTFGHNRILSRPAAPPA